MRVALTGAGGFLGLHVRAALRELGAHVVPVALGSAFDREAAVSAVDGADRVLHLAGVNRAPDDDIFDGNVQFAQQLASALRAAAMPPGTVVYANTTQADNGSVYGTAKARAADVLRGTASQTGFSFIEHHLPNLFGEHGRPFYNAVTATFCHLVAEGGQPEVHEDRELALLHAQDAADLLLGNRDELGEHLRYESVRGLLARIQAIASIYELGDIPDVATPFDRDLFNTYRSYLVDRRPFVPLTRHADARGSFFEIVRSHGGNGQSSFSITVPGITRGDHFHRRKIERFTVLAGTGLIRLRRFLSDQVIEIPVDGDAPVAVDMPTLWTHSIESVGIEPLYTAFWTDDLFDPNQPDTISERVLR